MTLSLPKVLFPALFLAIFVGIMGLAVFTPASAATPINKHNPDYLMNTAEPIPENAKVITLGAGCFWCVEAIYQRVPGVLRVVSGYMGGDVDNPTYEQVSRGATGHAEVIQVYYDPSKVSLDDLLDLFWVMHDPTTLNRQGADVGTQYRSAVFYHDDDQRKVAEASKAKADQSGQWKNPIVTEISPAAVFYRAEDYHQDYFNTNPTAGYCQMVILPKLRKLEMD